MTLTELVSEVSSLTRRPDQELNAVSYIRAATLAAHSLDDFSRDLVIATIANPAPLEYKISIPHPAFWKKWKQLNVADSAGTTGVELVETSISTLVDSYGYRKTNCYYIAGTATTAFLGELSPQLQYSYYAYPNVSTTGYASWVATNHPYYLIYSAAARVFALLGRRDMAQQYERDAFNAASAIVKDNITEQG